MTSETLWTVYRTRFLVQARQLTSSLVFTDALGREQSGRPGDYLVESTDGLRRIIARSLFEDIYVPLQEEKLSKAGGAPGVLARPPRSTAREETRETREERARA